MEIRFAMEQDVGGIIKLLQQVGRVHHEGRPDIFRTNAQKYGASEVLAMLNSSRSPIFVAVEAGAVLGGCLERSNTDLVKQMTDMVAYQRSLQSATQIMKMYDDVMTKATSEVGRL